MKTVTTISASEMEGVLMWKSCSLSTKFYNTLAGTYRVGIDDKDQQFRLETSANRLRIFYSSFIPMCLALSSCLLRLQDPHSPNGNSVEVSVRSFGEAAVVLACICLNIVVIVSEMSLLT